MKNTFLLPLVAGGMLAPLSLAGSYLDTAFGWYPHIQTAGHLSPSLGRGMPAGHQVARRYAGVPTAELLLEQLEDRAIGPDKGGRCRVQFLPSAPPKFMPYLDSVFVPGNTCAESCAFVDCDPVSTSAQKVKSGLSRVGLFYDLTLSANYTGIVPKAHGRRNDFMSFNNSMNATWYLLKDQCGFWSIFLSVEADWGLGANFNERKGGAQDSIGPLGDPQGSLRGGNGLFLPNLALGASLFRGKWVGMIGTLDTTNFLDQNAYSASWSGNLTNRSFNSNPCLPLEWANWGYMTAWQPCKNFYTMYATTGCNGKVNHNPFPYISSKAWVHIGELGLISGDFLGMGPGTYRFQYTLTRNGGRNGSGAAINFQQQLGRTSHLGFFTRCGVMDEDAGSVNDVRAAATAGFVLQAPFAGRGWGSRSNNDQVALGLLWERAAESAKPYVHKDEYGLELTAVVQLTPTFYLQPDMQYIFNPVHETDRSGAFVFQVQGVLKF